MFGFVKTEKEPLTDARSAQRWLASLDPHDLLGAHAQVVQEVGRLGSAGRRRKPSELEALFAVDAGTAALRAALDAQYIEHASRSPKVEQQLWHAMHDLGHAFQQAYRAFERELLAREPNARWTALLPDLLAREVMQLAADARVRMHRYEQWIPAKWLELHERYGLALGHGVHRQKLALADAAATVTIEQKYIAALVLHLANAGNLDRPQLQWLGEQLGRWCTRLRLSRGSRGPTALYVDLAHGGGLRRRGSAPLHGPVLFLDTEPLHSLLLQYVMAVEQKIRSEPLSPRTTQRLERIGLLTKVAAQIDTEYRPVTRRGERTAAAGKVDALVGFHNIFGFLREEQRAPTPELDSVTTFSGTLDIAMFGHMRDEQERRQALADRRLGTFAPPGGAWDIRDVSLTGVRLVAPMAAVATLTLGMLVALKARREAVWTLGIVRRMRRVSADSAEIGLQRIADSITIIELAAQQVTHDDDAPTGAGAASRRWRTLRGLFLAMHPRSRDGAVQSIILPAGEYDEHQHFRLRTRTSEYSIHFGSVMERQSDWVWAAVQSLPLARRIDVAASTGAT